MNPRDMQEAATLDGATLLRSLRSIVLPMSRPAQAAVIQGMQVWTERMVAPTVIERDRLRTLAISISPPLATPCGWTGRG